MFQLRERLEEIKVERKSEAETVRKRNAKNKDKKMTSLMRKVEVIRARREKRR